MIVTEGSKTEPEYFRRLTRELGLTTASVTITRDGAQLRSASLNTPKIS